MVLLLDIIPVSLSLSCGRGGCILVHALSHVRTGRAECRRPIAAALAVAVALIVVAIFELVCGGAMTSKAPSSSWCSSELSLRQR